MTIHQNILDKLELYLNEKLSPNYIFTSSFYDSVIQINGVENIKDGENTPFIKIGINNSHKQVYIPNIFIPKELRYKNFGKDMLSIIYQVSVMYKYDVFVIHLTEHFYNQLLKRGAVKCNEPDILQIAETTNLKKESFI